MCFKIKCAVTINRNTGTVEEPWLCGTLLPFSRVNSNIKLPLATAEVIFQYPISGKIVFRQLVNQEYADTVVIIESLVYSDGSSQADTFYHNWTINENPPEKDYYDWQNRCLSAGPVYNIFKVKLF